MFFFPHASRGEIEAASVKNELLKKKKRPCARGVEGVLI
jgi:hypothetical protein